MKMNSKLVLVILMQIATILTAPLQLQLLQPFQGVAQQQANLQQQLLALQELQVLQKLNALRSSIEVRPQPLLLLLPNTQKNIETNDRSKLNEHNFKSNYEKDNSGIEDNDADSIAIDAEKNELDNVQRQAHRAVLLIPNNGGIIINRGFIGEFISNIPFLPFEVNVPDSISWIYNGISSIISGIGQTLPFRPQMNQMQTSVQNQGNLKLLLKQLQTRKQSAMMPLLVMPLGDFPVQI